MALLNTVMAIVAGLVIGSFMNVVAYRVPQGQSVVMPPSRCPACGTPLKPIELVLVLSYIGLKGKCRHCGKRISFAYPLVEVVTAFLFVLAVKQFGWSAELWVILPLLVLLVTVTHIDLRLHLIPDKITYPGMVYFGLVRLFYHPDPWWHYVLGFLIAGGLLLLIAIASRGGMGGGDIKLMAMAGLALGLQEALLGFFIGTIVGGMFAVILLILNKAGRKDAIAFGPFLAFGLCVTCLWGEEVWLWYSAISF